MRVRNRSGRAGMLICCLWLILGLVPTALAQSTVLRLDFEDGADAASVLVNSPGILFSETNGSSWVYGDTQLDRYNAPYPESCEDRPEAVRASVCRYAVSGRFFAWMGFAQSSGRIDFTQGNVSFFEAGFSTADPLRVEAYGRAAELVASTTVAPNLDTGALTRVRLEATPGQSIASVVVSGQLGRWLMDDLSVDLPITQPQAPTLPENKPALVSVTQQVEPAQGAQPGDIVQFTLVAKNHGSGDAREVSITLPYDPTLLQLLDAQFSNSRAWVTEVGATTVHINTGPLPKSSDAITSTLRFAVNPGLSESRLFATRLSFTWRDNASGGEGRGNALQLPIGQVLDAASDALTVNEDGAALVFESTLFEPGEPVATWYNTPDGRAINTGTVTADADGRVWLRLSTAELDPGSYTFVTRGLWSSFEFIAPFQIQPPQARGE
ncbi:MAG: hypothetical protein HGA45_16700 [Chloroflexales bacterium]|nr:hypothetical protein [Chloroflexales bacterium]